MRRGATDFVSAPVLAAETLGTPTAVNADGPVHRHHRYALPPVTREVRAPNAKVYLNTRFSAKQQVFLDFVLSQLRHGRPLCWRRPRHRHRFRAHAHGLKVRNDFAMTGEITILGKVLQVGGIHQKLLAAYESGGKEVQIPPDNLWDTPFRPVVVNEKLTITPVQRVDQVLK